MEKFLIPTLKEIKLNESSKYIGEFHLQPLERGFHSTIGNALRRTLLASVPGTSVFAIKIEKVSHEFSTIKGVLEDVIEIILNLKELEIEIDYSIHGENAIELSIVSKKGNVTGKNIDCPPGVKILNPEHYIAETIGNGSLKMKLYVCIGRGYKTFLQNQSTIISKLGVDSNLIAIDSNFSPVKKVELVVEPINVGKQKEEEKLIIKIETKVTPVDEAIKFASQVLINYFTSLLTVTEEKVDILDDEIFVNEVEEITIDHFLERSISHLDIPQRAYKALTVANINTIYELVNKKRSEIAELKNVGLGSLARIESALQDSGLDFKGED